MSLVHTSRIALLIAATAMGAGEPVAAGSDEDVWVSYHPPYLVYFQEATSSVRRAVIASLRRYCGLSGTERPSAKDMGLGYETFLAFCENVPVKVFMGINHRRHFNSQVLICRKDGLAFEEAEKVQVFPNTYSETFEVGMRCIGMYRGERDYQFYETRE